MNCPICNVQLHTQSGPAILHPKNDCSLSLAELRAEHWAAVHGVKRTGAEAVLTALVDMRLPSGKMLTEQTVREWLVRRIGEIRIAIQTEPRP